jgi:hypothetical protein
MEWWGYSSEHGWVVLDRSLPVNAPGLGENLLFFRCRDATTIVEPRKQWQPPTYRFAPNYLRDLAPAAAAEASAVLAGFQARWPEFQKQMQQEQHASEERSEVIRLELEAQEKIVAKEKRKAERAAKKALNPPSKPAEETP